MKLSANSTGSFVIGFYDKGTVSDMLKECSRMYSFSHPNVLSLSGVCLDGGPAPFIIMPLMTNGSLLAHLEKNRDSLVISSVGSDNEADVSYCSSKYTSELS